MPQTGVMSLEVKQVCLGPVKSATCTDFVAKSRTTPYLTCSNNLICCKTGFNVDGKTSKIAFQLVLYCNIAKLVACFFSLFYRTLTFTHLPRQEGDPA